MIWRILTFAAVALVSGAIGMWASDRSEPVTVKSMRAITPVVEPGGIVKIALEVDRHRSCPLHIDHWITDAKGVRKVLPGIEFASLPGALGEAVVIDQYEVPQDFAPGPACYSRISTYTCNPIQRMFAPVIIDRGVGRGQACFEVSPK
jgi:hypothetical protein